MMRGGKMWFCVGVGLVLCPGAKAFTPDTPGGPYHRIVERNVFSLRAPQSSIVRDAEAKAKPPSIKLTGITTILGRKVTFLTIPAAKPGGPTQSFMLTEGQMQDEIEVIQIEERAGIVKIVNHGEAQTLDFDHDGAKPFVPTVEPRQSPTIPTHTAIPSLSQEEQVALIEIQRAKMQQEGDPTAGILPPTELTPR